MSSFTLVSSTARSGCRRARRDESVRGSRHPRVRGLHGRRRDAQVQAPRVSKTPVFSSVPRRHRGPYDSFGCGGGGVFSDSDHPHSEATLNSLSGALLPVFSSGGRRGFNNGAAIRANCSQGLDLVFVGNTQPPRNGTKTGSSLVYHFILILLPDRPARNDTRSAFAQSSFCRSAARRILPLTVLGRASTNSMIRGYLYGAVCVLT